MTVACYNPRPLKGKYNCYFKAKFVTKVNKVYRDRLLFYLFLKPLSWENSRITNFERRNLEGKARTRASMTSSGICYTQLSEGNIDRYRGKKRGGKRRGWSAREQNMGGKEREGREREISIDCYAITLIMIYSISYP